MRNKDTLHEMETKVFKDTLLQQLRSMDQTTNVQQRLQLGLCSKKILILLFLNVGSQIMLMFGLI